MEINPFDDRAAMYDGSEPSLRSNLDLFSLPKTDISCVYSTQHMPVFPLLSISNPENPIEFVFNSDQSYIDLSETYLKIGFSIRKSSDDTATAAETLVAPGNLMFGLMFKNLEVYLNNKLITDTSNAYPYVHYIQRMLTMPESIKNSKLRAEFYYPNDTPDAHTLETVGFKQRQEASKTSVQVFMLGQLVNGLLQQNRWIGPGNEIRIVLRRSHPSFCLDAADESTAYKVVIHQAKLLVQRKPVTSKVMEIHRSLLEKNETMKYILNEPMVKTASIATGLTS